MLGTVSVATRILSAAVLVMCGCALLAHRWRSRGSLPSRGVQLTVAVLHWTAALVAVVALFASCSAEQ